MTRVYELITPEQLTNILTDVQVWHEYPFQGRKIKTVEVLYDNREGAVYTIKFRHGGGAHKETVFTGVNRFDPTTNKMDDVRLFEEVMQWLRIDQSKEAAT